MRFLYMICVGLLLYACSSKKTIEPDMSSLEVQELIGRADSIQERQGIPDVYTNKLIKVETWFYGNDTMVNFADGKVQSILIQ